MMPRVYVVTNRITGMPCKAFTTLELAEAHRDRFSMHSWTFIRPLEIEE